MLEPQVNDTPELEVIEGDIVEPQPDRSIVSTENNGVLVAYEEPKPRYVEPEQPAYKNRALIAAVFAMVGILAGRMTMAPKETVRIVEKPIVIPAATNAPVEEPVLAVANPFRNLANTEEFDPWQPLNGGFPIPPKDVELAIAARSGNAFRPPNMSGTNFDASGPIEPFDPALLPGGLPSVTGDLNPLPNTPVPGGGSTTKPNEGTNPPPVAGKERYVQIAMNGPAPEAGQKSLLSIAAGAGGTGRSFVHYTEDGTVEAHGVLLIVPAGQYEAT
ncbi:MAG TPA: hypothetical protein VK171_14715, partial [Fimbriimonas sp.]|nr:hypothetical protein [Fimbriimonas sp.]